MESLDFETNLESAAETFLGTYLSSFGDIQIASSLDQDNFSVPRVEVNAQIQGADDPPTADSSGVFNYTQYNANFLIKVITDASDDTTILSSGLSSGVYHRRVRRSVRQAMLLESTNFTDSNLPHYEVKYMRPNGDDYEVDGDLAISTLSYDIKFCIKSSSI
tara:strand:+ start:4819 stop:5304 length:486 start_codon:yes stop_codon:yes gene_type:complete